jgi:hypothetical protein
MVDMKLNKLNQIIREEIEGLNNGSIIDQIINSGKFRYVIGSGSHGESNPTRESIIKAFTLMIQHEFFDQDFYYNWTDNKGEYYKAFKTEVQEPFINNLDDFVAKYIGQVSPYTEATDTSYGVKDGFDSREFINNYFRTSKLLPQSIKDEYNFYRWQYAGEQVDPQHYEYVGDNNTANIKRK